MVTKLTVVLYDENEISLTGFNLGSLPYRKYRGFTVGEGWGSSSTL